MTWSGRSLWTWTLSARASPATSTDSPIDSRWSRIASTSRLPAPLRLEQEHRLVAEALVGVARRASTALTPARRATASRAAPPALARRVQERALEQPDRPCPPESTTPASRRIGSRDGVRADRLLGRLDASRPGPSRCRSSRSAAATAASAASRMTVRIVPSTGFATAP